MSLGAGNTGEGRSATDLAAPDLALALPAGSKVGDYQLESVLGVNAFGITYLARDAQQRPVVLKEYFPADHAVRQGTAMRATRKASDDPLRRGRDRFLSDARRLQGIHHHGIVPVLKVFETHNTAYMAVEYQAGPTLEEALAEKTASFADEARLRRFALAMADGLEEVHAGAFLHGKVEPSNIRLREDDSPVILDFGAARAAQAFSARAGTLRLSPGYAAIEQYTSHEAQGPWTDLYGLAATLYRVVTGKEPLDAPARLLEDRLVPAVDAGSGRYSRSFLKAIDAALVVRPEDRPQTVAEWRPLLDPALAPKASEARRAPAGEDADDYPEDDYPTTMSSNSRAWIYGGIAASVVIVGGLAIAATSSSLFIPSRVAPERLAARSGVTVTMPQADDAAALAAPMREAQQREALQREMERQSAEQRQGDQQRLQQEAQQRQQQDTQQRDAARQQEQQRQAKAAEDARQQREAQQRAEQERIAGEQQRQREIAAARVAEEQRQRDIAAARAEEARQQAARQEQAKQEQDRQQAAARAEEARQREAQQREAATRQQHEAAARQQEQARQEQAKQEQAKQEQDRQQAARAAEETRAREEARVREEGRVREEARAREEARIRQEALAREQTRAREEADRATAAAQAAAAATTAEPTTTGSSVPAVTSTPAQAALAPPPAAAPSPSSPPIQLTLQQPDPAPAPPRSLTPPPPAPGMVARAPAPTLTAPRSAANGATNGNQQLAAATAPAARAAGSDVGRIEDVNWRWGYLVLQAEKTGLQVGDRVYAQAGEQKLWMTIRRVSGSQVSAVPDSDLQRYPTNGRVFRD